MKFLATIYPRDVDVDAPDFDFGTFRTRQAVRTIVFDGDEVAIIHVSKFNYYMLPGGGIDRENIEDELKREVREELACEIIIERNIGSIITYIDRWNYKQIDTCFVSRKIGETKNALLTEFEAAAGYEVIWAHNLSQAITLLKSSRPTDRDGKLIRQRDLLFLESL